MRGLFFCPERLWDAVRGFASLKLLALGRKPATKRTYQQHAPFRTEGFIQLRRSWPAVRQAANDRPPDCERSPALLRPARASPQRCIALIHFRIRLRVRNTDHKTMVEKIMNDGSAIGGSCRSELRVVRLSHCHAALPTVVGPQFRKSAGGDRSH